MSLLLARIGGAPPATPSIIEGWWVVFDDDDDVEDGSFYAAVFEAIAAAVPDLVQGLETIEDELEDDIGFIPAPVPPLNDFVAGHFADLEDDGDELEPWQSLYIDPPAVAVPDPVYGWSDAGVDEDEEPDPWAASFPYPLAVEDAPVSGFFESLDEPDDDEVAGVFDCVAASVAAADDFVQGLFEALDDDAGDEGLFEASWNPAFDPPPPAPDLPYVPDPGSAGRAKMGRFRSPREDHYDEDEELEIAILVATIMRGMQ